ncbi:MAG: glutamate racemase [Pseudomonadota bacterium]|nr:glutamate racemase [Pseudomonadota bacterium]
MTLASDHSARQYAARADAPIGIFDSGVGGLSVLRHVQQHLPQEALLYVADAGFAPYGGRTDAFLDARVLAIGAYLAQRQVKAIVVACNSATAASIAALRHAYPDLPVVGVEPGLKPAAAASANRIVGVMATEATLRSARFALLRESIGQASGVRFVMQACVGLADQIEAGATDTVETLTLLEQHVTILLDQGVDTLVLGCTHYPFVQAHIERVVARRGGAVTVIDTGAAVARQLGRVLAEQRLLRSGVPVPVTAVTTGSAASLQQAFQLLLQQSVEVSPLGA